MLTIISAIIFTFIIVLNVLLIFGLPLGELTMGGQYKVLPKKLRGLLCFRNLPNYEYIDEYVFKKQKGKIHNDTSITDTCCKLLDNSFSDLE